MLLVSTSSFRGYGLHKIFEIIAQSEYDGVDIVLSSSDFDTLDAKYLSHLSEITGVKIGSLTAYERKMDAKMI